jgi:hypothetical protein
MKKTILFCLLMGAAAALFAQTAAGTGTLSDPVPVSYSGGAKTLDEIYDEIAAAGKYVDLDLSALTGVTSSTGEANTWPASTEEHEAGKALIVSLKLPTRVTAIERGEMVYHYTYESAFSGFTNLKSVSAASSFTGEVCDGAFRSCSSLTTVSFPAAAGIGDGAFSGCSSLTTVSFPAAVRIGYGAFWGCSSLTTASFPAAARIGDGAFGDCSSLTTVSIPAMVTAIPGPPEGSSDLFNDTPFDDTYNGRISPVSITLKAGIPAEVQGGYTKSQGLPAKLWACYVKAGKAAGTYTRTGNGVTGTWTKK